MEVADLWLHIFADDFCDKFLGISQIEFEHCIFCDLLLGEKHVCMYSHCLLAFNFYVHVCDYVGS